MLIIELHALENGSHRNQTIDYLLEIPNGWAVVPEHLEAKAMGYLPFIDLTVENGQIVGVSQGEIPVLAEDRPHVYTELELAQQSITDLELTTIEQGQQITDLELMILEGNSNV